MKEVKKRKAHLPEFKAKVGLEALRGEKTVNQIGQEYGVHPVQVGQWKKEIQAQPQRQKPKQQQHRDSAVQLLLKSNVLLKPGTFLSISDSLSSRFRCICGQIDDEKASPSNGISGERTIPIGKKRSVAARTASSKRKLMFVNAMGEFNPGNGGCRVCE